MTKVVPSALAFSFGLVAEGTPVENAELEMEEVPASGVCRGCATETRFESFPLQCRACEAGFGVALREDSLPIREVVSGACEILGIDPLYVANEGNLLAVVAPETADAALEALRGVEGGGEAEIIGEVREEPARMVLMHTGFGGTRMIDMLVGDPLPRIR